MADVAVLEAGKPALLLRQRFDVGPNRLNKEKLGEFPENGARAGPRDLLGASNTRLNGVSVARRKRLPSGLSDRRTCAAAPAGSPMSCRQSNTQTKS